MATKLTWKGESLRRSILDVASNLFIERGLGGTTMQDIANALGLTRTALYYYFRNKEQILKNLTEEITLSAKRLAGEVFKTPELDPEVALRRLVEQHVGLVLAAPTAFRVVERNQTTLPPKLGIIVKAARREVFEKFADVIQRGVESGYFRNVDATVAAFAILGMCNWTAWWYKPDGAKSETEVATIVAALAVHSLRLPSQRLADNVPHRLQLLHENVDHITSLLSQRNT